MKTDEILQQDVMHSLQQESKIDYYKIVVISKNGIITLTGIVDHYAKQIEAENIAKKVTGVKSVNNKIVLLLNRWEEKKDIEITNEILTLFKWNWNTLNDTIKVKVINGWVTLSGEIEWNYQKEAAKAIIMNLIGVKGVSNIISIKSQNKDKIDRLTLKMALRNNLHLDSKNIEVAVTQFNIILKGTVDCFYQKELAGRIAWKAPGVIHVDNKLLIEE
jgi:osmotically-inducible protein OsmY